MGDLMFLVFAIIPLWVLYFIIKTAIKNALKELKNEGVL